MVLYERVSTRSERFAGRTNTVVWWNGDRMIWVNSFGVQDTLVVCNGCNDNLYPNDGYLVYMSTLDFKRGQAYDIYCWSCLKRLFPNARDVSRVVIRKKDVSDA